jgi:cob(I)alamin adenosyltransferase
MFIINYIETIMKVYTKFGDKGETALVGGKKVLKSSLRVEAYGTIDEANSSIGVLRAHCDIIEIKDFLLKLQRKMFSVGGEIACPDEKTLNKIPAIVEEIDILNLENEIDRLTAELKPITDFIIPGENRISSFAHVATTTCRRAERTIIRLKQDEFVRDIMIVYMNRLSDYLFTVSRYLSPENEEFWKV